jgi:hypothetical protein
MVLALMEGELLQAHLKQVPPSPKDVNPEVPVALSSAVMRAMAKRREDRFQSAAELRAALEQSLSPAQSSSRAPRPRPSTVAPANAWVALKPGAEPLQMTFTELSRAGAVLCTEGPLPPLRSRVALTLQLRDSFVPCMAEVVRHIPPVLAAAWGIHAGFAVEFVGLSDKSSEALARVTQGQAPGCEPTRLGNREGKPPGEQAASQLPFGA